MARTLAFILKVIIFAVIFWALMVLVAFCSRDDVNIYTRALMAELHKKEPIDIIFCGASHVSHGLNPALLDTLLIDKNGKVGGLHTFCSGTPTQKPNATKAIIAETLKVHPELKEVWFECDFASVQNTNTPHYKRSPSTSIFLSSHYLKDKKIKYDYLKDAVATRYYLNEIIPIGKNSLLNLDPRVVIKILRSKLSGDYWKNATSPVMDGGSVYVGRGCVLDKDVIKSGTFVTAGDGLIKIETIGAQFYDNLREIKNMLDVHKVKLICYSNPSSDFYLLSRANYDQYVTLIKDFCNEISVPYIDFSFAKPDLLKLTDEDFSDDNHLNITGVEKFTRAFANFYNKLSAYSGSDNNEVSEVTRFGSLTTNDARRILSSPLTKMFYTSFIQKLAATGSKVYGTEVAKRHDNALVVRPIGYNCNNAIIKAVAKTKDKTIELSPVATGGSTRFSYPPNTSGEIMITILLNGVIQTHTLVKYFWM